MNLFQLIQNPDFLTRFQQFKQMAGNNPRQQVEQLLQSGKVSRSQYDQAMQMARQLQNLLGK